MVRRSPVQDRVDAAPGEAGASGLWAALSVGAAGKTVELVTLALLATVVPRALGPDGYGQFSVALTVVTLGSLAMTLGGPTVMARYVPAAPAGERVAVALAIGTRLARGRAVQLSAIALAAALTVAVDPERFNPFVVGVVVVALALNVGAGLALQVGLGLGRTGPWSARFPLQNGVLIAGVLLLHELAGVDGAVLAILASSVAAALLGAWVVVPLVRESRADASAAVPEGALRFGMLHAGGAALVQLSHRGGVLAVALLAGSSTETGYTALAIGIALGATYAVLQLFTVSLPHLSERAEVGEIRGEEVLRQLAGGLLTALVPAACVAAVLLDRLVPRAFGTEFDGAVDAFGPALALVVLAPLHALAVQVAALRTKPAAALINGIVTATVFVAAAVMLVPARGAAGGTMAALTGVAAGGIAWVRLLPEAAGGRVVAASFAGSAAVLALATAL
jgi:O-antigen/teichoic acid export membrane protein